MMSYIYPIFNLRMVPLICTLLVIVASVTLLILTESSQPFTNKNTVSDNDRQKNIHHVDDLMYGAKFWLCVHVGCGLALSLHTSGFADQRFSFTDRLFYSYAFSLVVLLPARYWLWNIWLKYPKEAIYIYISVSYTHLTLPTICSV